MTRRIVCLIFSITMTALAASSTLAQGFPEPKPTDAHKVLAMDAGVWEGEVKMYLAGPDGKPSVFRGVESNKLVSGKLYLASSFKSKMGDREFEGHGLMGYDKSQKKYTGTWVDNFTEAPTAMSSTYDAKTKTMISHSTVKDETGMDLKQKQVTVWKSDKEKHFTIYLLIKAGDQDVELKLMEFIAKKK